MELKLEDVDLKMMEESERYVQGRFPQMILQDVNFPPSRSFFDAAQMRAAFRAGYDYARSLPPPKPNQTTPNTI